MRGLGLDGFPSTSSNIRHESYNFLGRLEELAQQEHRREKALVVGTAAALAVGLLAYIVK